MPLTGTLPPDWAPRVVAWQRQQGRQHLPWQHTRDPYRVWLSEIMLQQTQVVTVLDYYPRFLQRFPDVQALAAAPQDDVLGLWSGLGYYSRARNLHRCAQQVVTEHGGVFPARAEMLQALPGIGRSTAAAIAAFCFGERVAILDGNVRRVLSRVLAFSKDLARPAHERELWALAGELLPQGHTSDPLADQMSSYTQGMMDLGATICVMRQPGCERCPVAELCQARALGTVAQLPLKTRNLKRSALSAWLLLAQRQDGAVWLERRPPAGIWGGLYCPPMFDSWPDLLQRVPADQQSRLDAAPAFKHVLTHRDLHLHPVSWPLVVDLASAPHQLQTGVAEAESMAGWFAPESWPALGLPAPVRQLLLTRQYPAPDAA